MAEYLVDVEDAEWVGQWNWYVDPSGYVIRLEPIERGRHGRRRKVYLHRELIGLQPGDGLYVDHINRNRRDNRRSNLRIVTPAQSRQNTPAIGGTSGYRGVSFSKERGKWTAAGQLNGKRHHIGRFAREEDAARAASDWRREHMPFSVEPPA